MKQDKFDLDDDFDIQDMAMILAPLVKLIEVDWRKE